MRITAKLLDTKEGGSFLSHRENAHSPKSPSEQPAGSVLNSKKAGQETAKVPCKDQEEISAN